MIRSMTAFAHQETQSHQGKLSWELRTVNHRYLDMSVRVPDEFKAHENSFRTLLQNRLQRGKLEASLRYTPGAGDESTIVVNEPLARALIIACRQIEAITENPEPLKAVDILRWPGVTLENPPDLNQLAEQATELLAKTLDDLIATREREGKRLTEFLEQRCDQIAEIIIKVRKRRPDVVDNIRDKIHQRLADLDVTPDNNRLEQELVLLAQRLDVDEELDRLLAHLDEIVAVLERDEPVGRRLDFLMQEMNRETNTLASKSNDAETTQASVDLKVLIEQMREQIQNIE